MHSALMWRRALANSSGLGALCSPTSLLWDVLTPALSSIWFGKQFMHWIWLLPVHINKVLLEHNHTHFFTCFLWLLSCYNGRIWLVATETVCPIKFIGFAICPFTEKLPRDMAFKLFFKKPLNLVCCHLMALAFSLLSGSVSSPWFSSRSSQWVTSLEKWHLWTGSLSNCDHRLCPWISRLSGVHQYSSQTNII